MEEAGQSEGFLQGNCYSFVGKLEFFAVRDSAKVSVSVRLGSGLKSEAGEACIKLLVLISSR
jgi:hypothetical protein